MLDGGERGEITKVGIRSTRLLTRDDIEVIVPNSEMADRKVDSGIPAWTSSSSAGVDHPAERGKVSHQLYMKIYKALEREGIQIPFPQRDLWIRQLEGDLLDAAGAARPPASEPSA